MKYLIIDGYIGGTGIRDKYESGFLDPHKIGLDKANIVRLTEWHNNYQNEFYNQYNDKEKLNLLDSEGEKIALSIKQYFNLDKIEYYSDSRMTKKLL